MRNLSARHEPDPAQHNPQATNVSLGRDGHAGRGCVIALGGPPIRHRPTDTQDWVMPHLLGALCGLMFIGWTFFVEWQNIHANHVVIADVLAEVAPHPSRARLGSLERSRQSSMLAVFGRMIVICVVSRMRRMEMIVAAAFREIRCSKPGQYQPTAPERERPDRGDEIATPAASRCGDTYERACRKTKRLP